jgi:hypothetical protein
VSDMVVPLQSAAAKVSVSHKPAPPTAILGLGPRMMVQNGGYGEI